MKSSSCRGARLAAPSYALTRLIRQCRPGAGVALAACLAAFSIACDRDEQPKPSATTKEAPSTAASAASKAVAAPAPASSTTTPASGASDCPAGKWYYDYSDHSLETLLKNLADATVTHESGDFTCTIPQGDTGTLTCDTGGKPVVNAVDAKQAGMPMKVTVTLNGKSVTSFEKTNPGKLTVTAADMSGLSIEAEVEVAGQKVPFPVEGLRGMFGESGTVLAYRCQGDTLMLKPEVEGATEWQKLRRVE